MDTLNIVTLTLNPAIDTTVTLDTLVVSGINQITDEYSQSAGKGINISKTLTKFGIDNKAVVLAGRDNYEVFRAGLFNDGVSLNAVLTDGKIRENYTMLVGPDNNTVKINRKGVLCKNETFDLVIDKVKRAMKSDRQNMLVISGSFPPGIGYCDIKRLKGEISDFDVLLAIDTRSLTGEEMKLLCPYLIKPNIHEFCEFVNIDLTYDLDIIIKKAGELISSGIQNVIISLGKDGILAVGNEGGVIVRVPEITVLCDVGAGDNAIAGFIFGKAKGSGFCDCARYAAAFGTAAAMTENTGSPDIKTVEEILTKLTVTKIDVKP